MDFLSILDSPCVVQWNYKGVSHKSDSKKMEFGQKIKIVFSQRFLHHKLPKHRPFKI